MGIPGFPSHFGRYVLVQPLGRGGMGHVVLAMEGKPGFETLCVIKRMLPQLRARPEHAERFRHEASLARRMKHPTLVQTHAVGEADGTLYLVQEFVEGKDLSELIARCASQDIVLPSPLSLYIMSEIARGLAYAHDFDGLGLVHRDINPPNVRIGYEGQIKILDFGIAISAEAKRSDPGDPWIGKVAYLAPEQKARGPVDRRTDLYACGIMLWELLAGRPFGTSMKDGEVIFPDGNPNAPGPPDAAVAPPSAFNAEVSSSLDDIAIKAVSRDPAARYQTASEFRKAIEPLLPSHTDAERDLVTLISKLFSIDRDRELRRERITQARPLLDGRSSSAPATPAEIAPALLEKEREGAPRPPDERNEADRQRARSRVGRVAAAAGIAGALALALSLAVRQRQEHSQPAVQPAPPAASGTRLLAPTLLTSPETRPSAAAPVGVPAEPAPALVAPAAGRKAVRSAARRTNEEHPVVTAIEAVRPPAPAEPTIDELLASSRSALGQKRYQDAIRDADAAGRRGGGLAAHIALGNALLMARRLPDAEQEFATVLRLDPGNAVAAERLNLVRSMRAQVEP